MRAMNKTNEMPSLKEKRIRYFKVERKKEVKDMATRRVREMLTLSALTTIASAERPAKRKTPLFHGALKRRENNM